WYHSSVLLKIGSTSKITPRKRKLRWRTICPTENLASPKTRGMVDASLGDVLIYRDSAPRPLARLAVLAGEAKQLEIAGLLGDLLEILEIGREPGRGEASDQPSHELLRGSYPCRQRIDRLAGRQRRPQD